MISRDNRCVQAHHKLNHKQTNKRKKSRCQSRPTSGSKRRSPDEMALIRQAIYDTIANDPPMTVRQVFYQLVSQGVIDKNEAAYKNVVVRLLGVMRRRGDLPFDWIADSTRWMRKPRTYSSMESMLKRTAQTYRRSIWDNQETYVEVWLEKDALTGVLYKETEAWDVPLMVTRGYPSISFLHDAAEVIKLENKPAYLYYFGDHDPSGVHIPMKVEADLREFAPGVDLQFECVAVTPEQIEAWDLPTRPTKKSDSRSKNFVGESVEVDAIPPATLRQLVSKCIEQHIDSDLLDVTKLIEESERDSLRDFMQKWEDAC